jgi:trehalose/maltose hydrolase-like predicted phosphorylase
MNYNGLYFASRDILCEDEYDLSAEANRAALLTTGNGYMGVRASLEEYGSLGIQGCYIRGVLDEVVEIRLALADNLYMKK